MIDEYFLDGVKTRDLRDIISLDLGQPVSRGASWVFDCPFHDERTAGGFHVFKDGFKCFSCGVHGDHFDYRMKRYGETFQEACIAYGAHPDAPPPDPREQAIRAAEIAERTARELERKIEEAQHALEDLRKAQKWLQYHDQLDERSRQIWERRGIPVQFQDFWQLGYCEDYTVWRKDGDRWRDWWHSPSLSIPIWGYDWQVNNVKHRLLSEPPDSGKYIQEKRGVPAAPFIGDPDTKKGQLLLCEGEIKSMVALITLDTGGVQVAGLPGTTPDPSVYQYFTEYDPVYLCMDPDAYFRKQPDKPGPAEEAIAALGKERVRIIRLPDKLDDLILRFGLDKSWLQNVIRTAKRIR